MPELPEVESLRRILARTAVGRTIVRARIGAKSLRRRVPIDFSASIAGRRITKLSRRAKYLIVEFDGDDVLLVHLGMSGSLTHRRADFRIGEFDPRHDHLEFSLDDDSRLVYNDPRRFGMVRLIARVALSATAELKGLGPEPLSRQFNAAFLASKARGRRVAIKNLLMDQRIVAGIGNIYAAEILFRAGVRPTRRAGTTFRSYRDSRGEPGRFAERLRVYGREGKPCYTCSTPIKNVVVGARASFYCPKCQR